MKPIYLEINYFGPHEHSVIDFRKLDESPIFLIGGDTGAGKSTIFDAMTFALFNSTTGDRNAKEMRSQFAEPKNKTRVIFYFEQNGKLYKIERTPEQMTAKKKGTGVTKMNPGANLSVVDTVDGTEIESIATKPVDVGHAIAEILNLNADQFKKIILLPQNDFSEFLKSNTNDKEKILKKIFGTQLFTDFTTKLKSHYDEANKKAATFDNDIKTQIESPVWSDQEQSQLAELPSDQLVDILKTYISTRDTNLKTAESEEKKTNAVWKKADKEFHAAEDIQKDFNRLADSKQKYQTNIVEHVDDIKIKQNHILELQWANPLRETVRDLSKLQSEQSTTIKENQLITAKLHDSETALKQAQAEVSTLSMQEIDFDAKNKQAQDLTVMITKVQDIENIKSNLKKLQPRLTTAQENVEVQTAELNQIQTEIDSKEKQLVNFDGLQDKKDKLVKEKSNFVDTLTPLAGARDIAAKEVARSQKKLKQLHSELETKTNILTAAKKDFGEKIKTRKSLMIAQLRLDLEENEPCPVCGSLEHPAVENDTIADNDKLRSAMDDVDASQKKFAAADNDVKTLQTNIDEVSDEFEEQQQTAVKSLMALSKKYNELVITTDVNLPQDFDLNVIKDNFQQQIDELDKKIKVGQKISKELQELNAKQTDLQTSFNETNSQLDKITTEIKTRTNDLENKSKGIPDNDTTSAELIKQKNDLIQAFDTFQKQFKSAQDAVHNNELLYSNNQTKLVDNQKRLDQQTASLKNLSEKINQALSSDTAMTNDQDILDKWILELNQDRLSTLQQTISSYNKEKEMLQETIEQIQQKLLNVKQPDLSQLKQIADEAQIKHNTSISLVANATTALKDAQKSFKKVQIIMQQQGDFAKELAAVTSLYNVVNGKDGNDNKLKLETYVVQNYLQKILTYANATFLNELSNNRYSFVISDKASDRQRDHGLDINVYDRETNSVRSSDTLSGGETFIAALSIALSLSEVVQSSANGVQIDALFVDEGFGSLDDETLDKAMKALQDIGENRMVGVISHIDSMKQSIGQQLLVKKLGNGRSKIEIINK